MFISFLFYCKTLISPFPLIPVSVLSQSFIGSTTKIELKSISLHLQSLV